MRFELTYPRDNDLASYRLNHSATLSERLRKAAPYIRSLTVRHQAIEGTVQIGRTNLLQEKFMDVRTKRREAENSHMNVAQYVSCRCSTKEISSLAMDAYMISGRNPPITTARTSRVR
jgi:hypothetical protein